MYWLGRYLYPVTLTYILRSSAFYTFYVNIQYLLNYKAHNHQTLHSASPQCRDSAGTLTEWPWPIFHAPLTFTPLMSPFHMSSSIRPSAGLGGSVGCAVRLETRRSRVQPPPRWATFFRGDWSWNIFYGHSLPSADSRRAVVSFLRKNVPSTG